MAAVAAEQVKNMAIKINIYNQKAENVGKAELADKIFNVAIKESLVHQAMVAQMGNERQVLAHTKDRSEVSGGGKKPWRQKGTGRARVGSSRSPLWIGGGVTFGPRNDRNFKKDLNRKMKQKALCMVMSDKVKENNFIVLDKLEIKEYKTKAVSEILKALEKIAKPAEIVPAAEKTGKKIEGKIVSGKKSKRSILIVNDEKKSEIKYSFRNLTGIKMINLENINILDLLKYKELIITQEGLKKIEERYKQAGPKGN